ncbi:hypothetical protein [Rhizorhapis sp. SPR117]
MINARFLSRGVVSMSVHPSLLAGNSAVAVTRNAELSTEARRP